jgi:membrane-bound acyltransferase YfiQ involved in biofilm formation
MRRYGLDWLKVFVVFLLFPFHTARIFDWWEINYIKDAPNAFSSWFVAVVGAWFMPLLFVIAGFSAFHALQKRTSREYVKERILRLLIPLLFGLVLIVPVQGYYASLQHEGFTGNYIQYLGQYFTDFHDISGYTGGFTPAHLWFILYMFIISMCMLPIMLRLRTPKEGFRTKGWLLLAFVPMTAAEALPSFGGKNLFFYALLFLFGFLIARSEDVMAMIRRTRFITLIAALVLSPVYIVLASSFGWPDGITLLAGSLAMLRNLCVWLIILTLMGLADTYLNKPLPVLSYLSSASYPIYVLHQSVMMVIAYYVVTASYLPSVKFLVIMLSTLASCTVLYEICRRFAFMRFLLGMKA